MWKIKSQKRILETNWFSIRKDVCLTTTGEEIDDYFVIEKKDFVVIFALTNDHKVVLVRQYRHGIQNTLLELPGGDCNVNEKNIDSAKRELLEETGYISANFIKIGKLIVDPTRQNNSFHIYIATNLTKSNIETQRDEIQNIKVELIPIKHLLSFIESGKFNAVDSVSATLLAYRFLKENDYL